MADENDKNETTEPEATEAEAKPKRAAKPKAAAAKAAAGGDEAEATPKRTRAAAKKADDDAAATGGDEADAKPKRSRAAKPKAEAEEATEPEAEAKPTTGKARGAGTRAAAKKADDAEADDAELKTAEDEAPKPRRSRAAKPKADADDEPAAKPSTRERGNGAAPTRPVVRAQARYVRSSARKARLVCDHIRGKSVEDARAILAFTPRAVARDWSKLLESAIANAEHNHELDGEDLLVKAAHADEGPTLKRFRPRAMGRATPIRKRTSHLTILLTPKE